MMAEGTSLSNEVIQERAHFTRGCPETQERIKSKGRLSGFRNNMSPSQSCERPQHEWVTGSDSLSYDTQRKGPFPSTRRPSPTSNQALQALRVVINYAKPRLEVPQDCELLVQLGRIEEKLERRQRDFTDICVQTGMHSVDRE